jgi:hypothetical protein
MVVATVDYMAGRKKYGRPQALLLANNPGTVETIDEKPYYIPLGQEVDSAGFAFGGNEFIILSDDNRQALDLKTTRIEKRERTVNGRMRSYHIADKLSISTAWQKLPSRSFDIDPAFNDSGQASVESYSYTSDGGAGGVDLLDWYERYTGSFWLYLAYDKHSNFKATDEYNNLQKYNDVVEVFFSDFSHSIQKRGSNNFDYWDVNISMEEV